MISSWRRSRAERKRGVDGGEHVRMELRIPGHFRCPISLDLMKDPVALSTGITYDRESIETWIEAGSVTCPVTNRVLDDLEPLSNHVVRKMIRDWCMENRSYGVERIPTPRIPVRSHDVSEILSKIESSVDRNDDEHCREMVAKIGNLARDSERNKRCIVSNGACRLLSRMLEAVSKRDPIEDHAALLEEILFTLTVTMPHDLDEETRFSLSKMESLKAIVWLLNFGSLSGRRNAVLTLRSIVCSNQETVDDLAKIEGVSNALVNLIKEPICPTTTKASLLAMHRMISSSPNKELIISRFLETGLIDILLHVIVDSERSICEKSLGVLAAMCGHDKARKKAKQNALATPLLVKKLLRVSDLATEFSVSVLWNLAKDDEDGDGRVIVEALEVGAFQKLLLLLQVGCHESTKEKVTELLKMMNLYRNRVECMDSSNFRHLKRSF